ncbi:MAG TPA: glycosyltransferase family 39 protein [Verrucomicrobiae bacterium]|nr:glycosyltransferase family 39 protein [Verrucomicrobiae bacterium]
MTATVGERIRVVGVLAFFAGVFCVLAVCSYTRESATMDEPQHLTSGYCALKRHDYRIDPEHPPFLRMWAALPLLAIDGIKLDTSVIDPVPTMEWAWSNQFDFCHQFMYFDNDADRLLYAARFMVVALGVFLGVMLFSWVNEWLGFRTAVITLGCYTIEPNIIAHSSLVTTDLAVTCFVFGTIYFLWRTCRHSSVGNTMGLAVFFALANISKFSGLILGPIVVLLLLVAVVRFRALKPAVALAIVGLLASTTWLAIWAVYGFRYAPSASSEWVFQFHNDPVMHHRSPIIADIVGWLDACHLLPNAYTQGFLLSETKLGARAAYLAGNYSTAGWWYYFPVAFAVKTPVSLIVLLISGGLVYIKRWRQLGLGNIVFVLLPVGLYVGPAMSTRFNIGLRHILPIYPFLLLVAAAAVKELLEAKQRTGRAVIAALAVCWLLEFGRVYPKTLAFFNQFVGGPRKGYEYLVDSNLDWGQDLKPLKRWMDQHGVAHINLAYFGSADPTYYHIDCTYLPGAPPFAEQLVKPPQLPGYVAVSDTILVGAYLTDRGRAFYRPLRDREPVADIGYSIRVYWADQPWWPP